MSMLSKVFADHLAAAHADARLSPNERSLIEGFYVALDAFGRGKDLWTYCREVDERVPREETASVKGRAVKSRRAKSKRRDSGGRGEGSRPSTRKMRSKRRAA
jgi:hypothetical protein